MKQKYNLANGFEMFKNMFKSTAAKNLLIAVLLFFGVAEGFGQGADCGIAVAVNVNTEYTTFNVTDNTVNDPTQGPVNGQTMLRDGWFSFVSNGTEASIRVVATNRNPMIFAYSGACGGLTLIGSVNANTGTGGHTEILNLTGLTNGVTYYVRIGNSTANNMNISSFHILTNDRCVNAFLLTSNTTCTTTTNSTVGATDNDETGDCTTGTENAVWYQFQAVATTHVVTVDGIVGFDAVIQALNTCGVAVNPTGGGCVDATNDGGVETMTLTGLTIGNFYKIQIHDYYGVTINNAFTICVTHIVPPTITSFTPSNACASSSQTVVITGTNFTGATAVTIGGTAAVSYIVNSATQITATIGTGTTGTIAVTTSGGSATSGGTFTVNPLPAAIGGGAATVCTGATSPAFTNATAGGTWSITNGTGSATISAGGVVTGVTAGTVTVVYTLPTTCAITRALTVQQTPGAIAGGAATVCVGASTPAFTNPNTGGIWSVVSGTGTASITSPGGILTGTSAGTVTVRYTIGACTPATFGVTVNAVPVITTQPVVASICTTNSGTFSVVATGATTYQWRKGGVALANVAPYSGVTSATLTITNPAVSDAGNFDVIVGNGTCSVTSALRALTVLTAPAAVATPTPANTATGVCYAGGGAVTSISWGAAAGATSYDVYFGAGSLPGAVTANVATNSYTTGTLLANTTYYWRIVAKNACGDAPTSATFSFTTSAMPCYCPSSGSTFPNGITGVTFNTISNLGTTVNTAYTNFTSQSTNVLKGSSYNLSVYVNTGGNYTDHQSVYIDWNGNGSFADAGEFFSLGTATNVTNGLTSLSPRSITVPIGAVTGAVRMRIQTRFGAATTGACQTVFDGEVEDYTINIYSPTPCVAPTAQPTSLGLTPSGTSISGSFTAASPASDNYLVVVSTSATPPSAPVAGTTYANGSSLASGYIVVDNDSNTTFTVQGLNISTTYYFYIFSYNGLCTSGPLYNTTNPLTASTNTTAVSPVYCGGVNPSSSAVNGPVYINSIRSVGTINDVTNGPTGFSATGYGNYSATTIATQIPSGGINIEMVLAGTYNSGPPANCTNNSQFTRAWVDWNKDGDFDDAGELVFISGSEAAPVATSIDNIFGFVVPSSTFPGNYRLRIRTKIFQCDTSGGSQGIINSCGPHDTGETEDYTIAVVEDCPSKILSVTGGSACGPTNTVTLNATKTTSATGFKWYSNLSGGSAIATTTSGTWTTPAISATTTYYVTAYDGICETIHRTPVVATILTTSIITVTPSVPEVCGEGNVVTISASGDVVTETLLFQNFESGMAPFTVTYPTNVNGGSDTPWTVKTSVYVPTGTTVWRPAVNSGAVGTLGNRFAFTTSDYQNSNIQTIMTSPVINAALYTTLALTFDQMYGAFSGDSAVIEAYDGTTWTTIASYTATDIGTPSLFTKMAPISLNSYAGNPNLQIRFIYTAQWDDGWAVDNIKVEGVRPLNTTFTWTGGSVNAFVDAALTTPYVAQSVTTVYVVPNAMQLASPSWSFTANATLGNGCPVSKLITINNKTKLWKGTVSNDWYDGNNWSPIGVPDANTCVFIYDGTPFDSNINISANNAFAKFVTVRPLGLLEIQTNNKVTVTDAVSVDAGGTFTVEDSGSLIQINNVANLGNINYKRIAPGIRGFDYVYWSSPVANQAMETIYTSPVSGFKYEWNPTVPNTNAGLGNWENAGGVMQRGKGYIIRGSSSYGMGATNIAATFTGIPHNGTIPFTVARGSYTGVPYNGTNGVQITNLEDNYNLLGNPYPSAIDVANFLGQNSSVIHGNVKLWRHGSAPAAIVNPFYGSFTYNYNGDDYLTINSLGISDPVGSDPIIKSGQAFLVQMLDGPAATGIINFTNSMRLQAGLPLSNSNFFRNSDAVVNSESTEKHRIWLDIMDQNNIVSSTLVGYATGASDAFDSPFDARSSVPTFMKLYSLIDNEVYDIQGRSLPFNNNDQVPLGITTVQAGTYSIGLNTIDGLFLAANQGIYLEDKTTNIIHNLKTNPYSFTSAVGTFHNRFVLRYTNETLGNDDFIYDASSVWVSSTNELTVKSSKTEIQSVRVFDILGRELANFPNVNGYEIPLTKIQKNNSGLIIQVTLKNGIVINKKTIY